jgi:phosphotransferase system HPr (HPr) family protein
MSSCDVSIPNRLGLHARAAAKFVHVATRFKSQIRVARDNRIIDGKSIMSILLLAAPCGASIRISADGPDESDAISELCKLVESGFGEPMWNV